MKNLASLDYVKNTVREYNLKQSTQDNIMRINEAWIDAKGQTEDAREILNNDLSVFIKSYQSNDTLRYGDIIVTDARGRTIGMTKTLTDYFQADEGWWELTYNKGKGSVILENRGFDESIGTLVLGVIAPIIDGDKVIGIFKINYKIKELLDIVSQLPLGKTGENLLINSQGDIVIHSSSSPKKNRIDYKKYFLEHRSLEWFENTDQFNTSLGAYAPLKNNIFTRIKDESSKKGVSGEEWMPFVWHVVVTVDKVEAFTPINRVTILLIGITGLVILAVIALSIILSKFLSRPIEKLKLSTHNLAEAQRLAHIGNWNWDMVTGDLTWSDEVYKIFGLKPQEFDATYDTFLRIVHPEDRDLVVSKVNSAVKDDEPYDIQHRIVLPDATTHIVHDVGKVFRDQEGKPLRMVGTVQDITEVVKAEEKIRKLSRAIEQSPAMVVITDLQGRIEYVNPEFTRVSGYTFDESIGKTPDILKSSHTTEEEYKALWKTITSGEVWEGEFFNIKKDGMHYWESALIAPIKNDAGVITHFVAVKLNITERKKAEEALSQKKTELLELNNELHQLITETSRIEDRERKRFSEILHDVIGQNLVLIKMNLERGLEVYPPDDKEGSSAISKAFSLLQDTIETTRSITTELYPSILDSKGLIPTLEWYKENVMENMGININLDIDMSVEKLKEHSKRTIYRLIKECLQNIIKHAEASNVYIACYTDDDMLRLSITDDGVGFDEKETDTKHGLGLLMMREQAVSLDTELNIHSQAGKGTEVSFTIPFQQ